MYAHDVGYQEIIINKVSCDEFSCIIVTYAEELASIYICHSSGNWFNTPLFGFITSTCVQYCCKLSTSTDLVSVCVWYKVFVY